MAAVFLGGARASGLLFRSLLWDVARSPIGFFERTPVGSLLNRFSKETDTVDVDIPDKLRSLLTYAFGLLEVGLAVTMATPLAIVAILPLAFLYAGFQVWRCQSPGLAEVASGSPPPLGNARWEKVCSLAWIERLETPLPTPGGRDSTSENPHKSLPLSFPLELSCLMCCSVPSSLAHCTAQVGLYCIRVSVYQARQRPSDTDLTRISAPEPGVVGHICNPSSLGSFAT